VAMLNPPLHKLCPTMPDTLLQLISEDGYSTGKATLLRRGRLCSYIDASKDGERWRVIADNRLDAVVKLMEMLGLDLRG